MWLKLTKSFRGGRTVGYIQLPDDSDNDTQEDAVRYWAEGSAGGHNYGWTVNSEQIDCPPAEWLNKRIVEIHHTLDVSIPEQIKELKNRLNEYLKLLYG